MGEWLYWIMSIYAFSAAHLLLRYSIRHYIKKNKKQGMIKELINTDFKLSPEEQRLFDLFNSDSDTLKCYTMIHILDNRNRTLWVNLATYNDLLIMKRGFDNTYPERLSNMTLAMERILQYENLKQININKITSWYERREKNRG